MIQVSPTAILSHDVCNWLQSGLTPLHQFREHFSAAAARSGKARDVFSVAAKYLSRTGARRHHSLASSKILLA
ncbi:hypothetical protein KCP76_14125 [Salmonella enterica subsp. enterica serovar Weltevreden]|nr:hypothetical protein KCP76_14125 [Salmonella enterica subsp. enterica serovar Weltevreden]